MPVNYPIFLFEKDDASVRILSSEGAVNSWAEAIDVRNGEYLAWDQAGAAVHLYTENERIKLRPAQGGVTLAAFLKTELRPTPELEVAHFMLTYLQG